jgi:GT2 family glycosyltransferase
MGKHKVSIIIPNYNGEEHLKRLLPSIANQNFDDYEVLIIDDCSPDRSVLDYIKSFIKDYRNFNLVENNENLGFVKTCNKGIGLSRGDYICLLNNDTEVKSNFVQRNVEILDADSSIGVLSCIIVDKHGKNWFSGGSFKSGLNVNLKDDFRGVRTVDWVAGTASFFRRNVFNRVGLLDEDFFMYHEDIEFCLRVRSKTNYKVCMFSDKLVTHYLGVSRVRSKTNYKVCMFYDKLVTHYLGVSPGYNSLYYLHRNYFILLKRYCPEYIPKALLLRSLRNVVILTISCTLKLEPRYFFRKFINITKGTIDGLNNKLGK